MAIQVGYACLALGVPGSAQKSCTLRTATPQKLCEVIGANLAALQQLVWYNAANGIKVFRISSDLIPFGSSPANTLPWQQQFAPQFAQLASEYDTIGELRENLTEQVSRTKRIQHWLCLAWIDHDRLAHIVQHPDVVVSKGGQRNQVHERSNYRFARVVRNAARPVPAGMGAALF